MPTQTNTNQLNYNPVQPAIFQNKSNRKPLLIALIITLIIFIFCTCCIGLMIIIKSTAAGSFTSTSNCASGVCTVKVCNRSGSCVTDKCYTKNCENNLRSRLEDSLK